MRKQNYELFIGYDKNNEVVQYSVYIYTTWFWSFTTLKVVRTNMSREPIETFTVVSLPYTV